MMLRRRPISSSHEDFFIERYEWLLSVALHLTGHDRGRAEDLVHDAFIRFTLTHPDPQSIQNLDGYLYTLLRNLHLSQERRATRRRLQQLSILDYDSVEMGLRVMGAQDQIRVQDELRRVCHYACARKDTARAASILILRFFHGYYPSEIARILLSTRRAVDERLRVARAEARLSLDHPKALSFAGERAIPEVIPTGFARATDDFVRELRALVFQSRRGDCLSSEELEALYRTAGAAPIECAPLAHIVSCASCLDAVNTLLGLPLLADRYPTDMLGKDTRPKGGRGGGSMGGGNLQDAARQYRRRMKEVFEHRPKELHILVNGFVLGTQAVNSELSEQTLDINLAEKIGFVEVLSEQEAPLLFLNVEPPPDGPVKQPARVELSDGRTLDLTLSFSSAWPTLHVVYSDPLLKNVGQTVSLSLTSDQADGEDTDAPRLSLNECATEVLFEPFKQKRQRFWQRLGDWSFWLRPSAITAILAFALIAVWLFVRLPAPPVSAAELLQKSAAAEELSVGRTDSVLHRTIRLEERRISTGGELIARRTVELWRSAEKKATGRRVYNERGQLVGGEWIKEGSRMVYRQGARLQPALEDQADKLLAPDSIWRLEPSARVFAALIRDANEATVEERPAAYVLNYQSGAMDAAQGSLPTLIKATLVLSRADLHATEQTLVVRQGSETREYRFMEAIFERRAPNAVVPAVFEPDPELFISGMETGGGGDTAIFSASPRPPVAATLSVATAELEVEALRLLSQAGADLGEQVSVARAADGYLKIQGIVETDQRKREILSALAPISQSLAVQIEISTVTEAVARQQQQAPVAIGQTPPIIVQRVETADESLPVENELRKYFSKDKSRGEEEARRFADRMVEASRRAMSHTGALKRLVNQFSPEDLRTLMPQARAKWIALIQSHARAFERETARLRQELQPIFFPVPPSAEVADESEISDDAGLSRAVERLFELGLANEQVIRSAFTVSAEKTRTSAVGTPQFWQSLKRAEKLAATIQTAR